ncbi:hypothetical protein NEOKW01_0297 [Nematocida sp. AWRm80]|nr:hypothetical protein NEOKW01_0297 [Nematocida sp. AWRm80]
MPKNLEQQVDQIQKAHTLNEQKEHVKTLKETLTALMHAHTIPPLKLVYQDIEKLDSILRQSNEPQRLFPETLKRIAELSKNPIVQASTKKSEAPPKNNRTLYDIVSEEEIAKLKDSFSKENTGKEENKNHHTTKNTNTKEETDNKDKGSNEDSSNSAEEESDSISSESDID